TCAWIRWAIRSPRCACLTFLRSGLNCIFWRAVPQSARRAALVRQRANHNSIFHFFYCRGNPTIRGMAALKPKLEVVVCQRLGETAIVHIERNGFDAAAKKLPHESQFFLRSQLAQNP